MMTFRFNLAKMQDNDDALIFDAICEDVDPTVKDDIELEFSGDNFVFDPPKVAVKDIFNQQSGHAHCQVLATPKEPGPATAIMQTKIDGADWARIERGFTIPRRDNLHFIYAFLPTIVSFMRRSRTAISSLSDRDQAIVRRFRVLRDSFSGDPLSRLQALHSQPMSTRVSGFAPSEDAPIENDALTSDEQALLAIVSDTDFYNNIFTSGTGSRNITELYSKVRSALSDIFRRRAETDEQIISQLNNTSDSIEAELQRSEDVLRRLNLFPSHR